MATSRITIYKTKLEPGLNAKVDDINYYLNNLQTRLIYSECQYQKLELEMKIKVEMNQKYHFGAKGYNYLKLEQDSKVYYFFILDSKWKANETVELILSMDTINSFVDNMEFTANTHITRQHKDRFVQETLPTSGSVTLLRYVDEEPEGINPTKFYDNNKKKIYDEQLEFLGNNQKNSKWYLIYRANADLTTTSQDANNPVELLVTSNYPFLINGLTSLTRPVDYPAYVILQKYNSPETKIFADNVELPSFGSNVHSGTTVRGWIWYRNGQIKYIFENSQGQYVMQTDTWTTATTLTTSTGFSYGKAIKIDNVPDAFNYGDYQLTNFVGNRLQTIDTINRTESRYMKIIEIPYPPFDFTFTQDRLDIPDGWLLRDGMFYTTNVEKNFYRDIRLEPINVLRYSLNVGSIHNTDYPKIELESKLYNSEFYDYNVRYDSFEKQFLLERFKATNTSECQYNISFKPSNTINSNFIFDFNSANDVYKELDIRSEYMNIQRNNELPMYNSDYLNYIRNGYNYDKKNKNFQIGQNLVGVGINAIGTIAQKSVGTAFGKSSAVGLAVTTVSQVANTVFTALANERAIQQKLQDAKNSPTSVNGSDDLDLMNYVTNNKLEVYSNSCSENMKKAIFKLFRLTGYSCNTYDIPDTDSRLWYNFVQCEPVFRDEELLELPKDVLDDIKAKYQIGVTYFHKVDNTYDFERDYENYESWMINR